MSFTGNIITRTGKLRSLILIGFILILLGLGAMSVANNELPNYAYSGIISLPLIGQGFAFPTLIVAQLAASSQDDAAIATATLLLLKNLGNVLGVAVSGLVSQNTLVFYLFKLVEGPEKIRIIDEVRQTVGYIRELQAPYRSQGLSIF